MNLFNLSLPLIVECSDNEPDEPPPIVENMQSENHGIVAFLVIFIVSKDVVENFGRGRLDVIGI